MRAFLFLFFLICFKTIYVQTNYYTFNIDSIFSEQLFFFSFDSLSNKLPNNLTLKPVIYHRIIKNDSIINYLNFVVSKKDTFSLLDKLSENVQNDTDKNNLKEDGFKYTFQQDSLFLLLGKKLPEFSLKDLEGNNFSSKQLIGKPTLINYWSIYCKPCVKEISDLNKLRDKYKNKMIFIAITESACSKGELENFLHRKPFNFKILTLGDEYKKELKIQSIPVNIFIDGNGIIKSIQKNYPMDDRGRESNKNDNNYFVRIIDEMIK